MNLKMTEIQTWFKKTVWEGPDGPVSCDQQGQFTDCCMFPTGTVANYSIMVNTPAGGTCAHNEAKYCSWGNISDVYCMNTAAFDGVGCWPDDAKFQVVGPQKLYTADPGNAFSLIPSNFPPQLVSQPSTASLATGLWTHCRSNP